MPADRCAGRCAWGGCLPGRCTAAESAGSPLFARFAPRLQSRGHVPRSSRRVAPDGLENRGASLWRVWLARVLAAAALVLVKGAGFL